MKLARRPCCFVIPLLSLRQVDVDGKGVPDGGGSLFLETKGRYVGPGHAGACRFRDEASKDRFVFTFHYYDDEDFGEPKLGARYLGWNAEDWPVLAQESIVVAD